jgi:hypothetical protein
MTLAAYPLGAAVVTVTTPPDQDRLDRFCVPLVCPVIVTPGVLGPDAPVNACPFCIKNGAPPNPGMTLATVRTPPDIEPRKFDPLIGELPAPTYICAVSVAPQITSAVAMAKMIPAGPVVIVHDIKVETGVVVNVVVSKPPQVVAVGVCALTGEQRAASSTRI